MGESRVSYSFSHFKYADVFEKHLPYYLSIGMSYELYWYGDPKAVIGYRQADELRHEQVNTNAWLQGAYIYNALCAVSPILQAFAKKGTKPLAYLEKPYPLKSEEPKVIEHQEQKQNNNSKAFLEMWAIKFNANFKKKEMLINGKQ